MSSEQQRIGSGVLELLSKQESKKKSLRRGFNKCRSMVIHLLMKRLRTQWTKSPRSIRELNHSDANMKGDNLDR